MKIIKIFKLIKILKISKLISVRNKNIENSITTEIIEIIKRASGFIDLMMQNF